MQNCSVRSAGSRPGGIRPVSRATAGSSPAAWRHCHVLHALVFGLQECTPWLKANNLPYTEVDITTTPGAAEQVEAWAHGATRPPLTFDIDGKQVDFDEARLREVLKKTDKRRCYKMEPPSFRFQLLGQLAVLVS